MAQRHIGLQEASDECLLGLGGADPHEHGRKLSPDVLGRGLVAQPALEVGDDRVAVARQRAGGLVDELGTLERGDQRLDELVADVRRGDRMASRATDSSSAE
jgi:hypothetical protein